MASERERKKVFLRSHGSLADFSPRKQYSFDAVTLAKDAIEGAGIPHPEVDIFFVNGTPADFRCILQDKDELDIFPTGFHPHLYSPARPPTLPELRFIVDENSGKIASALLLLGFDTEYNRNYDDPRLAEISDTEDRILLTRDIGLLKRARVRYGYWIRNDNPRSQTLEVIRKYDLWPKRKPLTRCLKCNFLLQGISREHAKPFVPFGAWERNTEFFRCDSCASVYWKGSHFTKMQEWLDDLGASLQEPSKHQGTQVARKRTLTEDTARDTEDDLARRSLDQLREREAPDHV